MSAEQRLSRTEDIPTQIKNPDLVDRRRRQIADAAVQLFIDNGFHKTTTRQIARKAGVSIGSLYEYIASKEDVLYLVCESIYFEVEKSVAKTMEKAGNGGDSLSKVIRAYFLVCHRMSDLILLIYRETRSLPLQWQKRVQENELRITGIFVQVLSRLAAEGVLPNLDESDLDLTAHNISVLGHMWSFRRWYLARHYRIEDYINQQTEFILGMINKNIPEFKILKGEGA